MARTFAPELESIRRRDHELAALLRRLIERDEGTSTTAAAPEKPSLLLTVPGILGIQADAAARASFKEAATITGLRAEVKTAPTGAAITVVFMFGTLATVSLTIATGTTLAEATAAQLASIPEIPANTNVRVDFTSVGTTEPGRDFSGRVDT